MKKVEICENVIEIEKYLRKVDSIIRRKGREILKDFEITVPQFSALQWLINEEGLTVGKLSKKMSLACSTITDLIDRMEKNGLVARKRDDKDKRIVRIKVMPKGYELVEKVLERRRAYLAEKLKELEKKDMILLSENLKSLYEAMEKEQSNSNK
ncbi:MarR family winged helix-turn-helix transcriptional regulator [Caldisalinibacter kiritimatiensis]|uniref:Transcriptional regulator, MarR family n=1 Tax=Caldisalinibacter kiritimatiensis TaxID=1304284 RepID=R1CSM4_9FIRM|nr:MarR family transcriptional regulator [Caldisalinibacter kiritimatiensis]EOD01661.1 Transcriptional regulator, MarR family [Caldisalinibacter kiritimatiensis]